MFWGATLKQGHPCRPSPQSGDALILHLSHAWTPSEAELKVKIDGQDTHIITLSSRCSTATLNLYFDLRQETEFQAQGSGVVYLTGYFEPFRP